MSAPLSFASGVYDTPVPPPVMATEPLAPCVTAVIVSAFPSMSSSLPSTSIAVVPPSSSRLFESSAAAGLSLAAVIVTWTSPVSVPPLPSSIVYVKVSAPLAFASGS